MNNPPDLNTLIWIPIKLFNTWLLPFIGMILIGMLIYGGIARMLAGANPQNVARANAIITWAIIGVVITVASVMLIRYVNTVLGINSDALKP